MNVTLVGYTTPDTTDTTDDSAFVSGARVEYPTYFGEVRTGVLTGRTCRDHRLAKVWEVSKDTVDMDPRDGLWVEARLIRLV